MPDERLVVGIDFSKHFTDLALLQGSGELLQRHRRFGNHQPGYQQAKAWILNTLAERGLSGLDVAGEATSYYWLPLYLTMEKDADLAGQDLKLFLINPKWVYWHKKSLPPNHKNDRLDPQAIASYLIRNRRMLPWHSDEHWQAIRFSTRMRFHLVKDRSREKNLFDLFLFLMYTTYARREPFANPLIQTSQALLRDPEQLAAFLEAELPEVTAVLHELSHHRLGNPQRSAERLKQILAERFVLPEELALPIQRNLELLLDHIQYLETLIAQVEGWLTEAVGPDYPEIAWLMSIPGIGLVIACGIAAEIGNLSRFTDIPIWDDRRHIYRLRRSGEVTDAIGKYAGLWWPENSSGEFQAEDRPMSRAGNAYLRYYLIEAGDRMRQQLPDFAAYYRRKYDQANHHKHKRALTLTGRKALDLVVALLRHRQPYRAKEAPE